VTLQVRFDPAARDELAAAHGWYEQASLGLGDDFAAELWDVIDRIVEWPSLASVLTVPGTDHEVRRANLQRFPYGVVYLLIDDVVWIVAIAHGRRRPGYWRNRPR
jgi:hypothetical protein